MTLRKSKFKKKIFPSSTPFQEEETIFSAMPGGVAVFLLPVAGRWGASDALRWFVRVLPCPDGREAATRPLVAFPAPSSVCGWLPCPDGRATALPCRWRGVRRHGSRICRRMMQRSPWTSTAGRGLRRRGRMLHRVPGLRRFPQGCTVRKAAGRCCQKCYHTLRRGCFR